MPKVTWCKVKPKVNYLAAAFSAYKKANKLTDEQIAEKLGCTRQSVNARLKTDAGSWTLNSLKKYSAAFGIPFEEAMSAAAKTMAQ